MEVIVGGILGLFFVAAMTLLVVVNRKNKKGQKEEAASIPAPDCCGAHELCEYDQIKMDESRIEYYNDEELDAYKEIPANNYNDSQIDEFREVLYTLKTDEIRYWLLSIERRKINLPVILHEEARMLMAEG